MDVVRFTPTKEELIPSREIQCTYQACKATFTNIGNLNMHIKRHHGSQPPKPQDKQGREFLYHCPEQQCIYHELSAEKKHFSTLKYLRQHYQKMHLTKTSVCDRCGRGFISYDKLLLHMEMCGVKYVCTECGWDYDSKEALLTHGKRKGHNVRDVASDTKKKATQIRKRTMARDSGGNNHETQTLEMPPAKYAIKSKLLTDMKTNSPEPRNQETQTDDVPKNSTSASKSISIQYPTNLSAKTETMHASTNTQPPLELLEPARHIETQTDDHDDSLRPTTTFNNSSSAIHTSLQPHLLPPSIHTYTQTYDDLLTDSLLGFTDIQTQTNWSSFSDAAVATAEDMSSHQYNVSSVSTCTRCTYDELLVSTETQTSFTQCLLDSRATNTHTEDANFSNLYQTQHTQTCDVLLGALFGSQEADLIGGYQSTHTQT